MLETAGRARGPRQGDGDLFGHGHADRDHRRAALRQCRRGRHRPAGLSHHVGQDARQHERARHRGDEPPAGLPQHAQSEHQVDPRFHRERPHRAAGAESVGAGDHAADDRGENARQVRRDRQAHRRHEPSGRHRRDAVGQARDHVALHLGAVPVSAAGESRRSARCCRPTMRPTGRTRSARSRRSARWREANPQLYKAVHTRQFWRRTISSRRIRARRRRFS